LDEGVCDYWAAAMLGTPHIWAWHHRHDQHTVHPRSLASKRNMADFDDSAGADAHSNGTIWGAAPWALPSSLGAPDSQGARPAEVLVVRVLLPLGRLPEGAARRAGVCALRSDFGVALDCLLRADHELHAGEHRAVIEAVFARRGIHASTLPRRARNAVPSSNGSIGSGITGKRAHHLPPLEKLARRIGAAEIP